MGKFKEYRRTSVSEMYPYKEGTDLSDNISVSDEDKAAGSPKAGDMIARNPKNHKDQWLVAKQYFEDNLEEIIQAEEETVSAPSTWQERLATEREELSTKLDALTKALSAGTVPASEVNILGAQKDAMVRYLRILVRREEKAANKQ